MLIKKSDRDPYTFLDKLLVNIVLWAALALLLLGLKKLLSIAPGSNPSGDDLEHLIDLKTVVLQLIAVLVVVGLFVVFASKLQGKNQSSRVTKAIHICVSEGSNIYLNLGSLLLVTSLHEFSFVLPLGALVAYAISWFLFPHRHPQEPAIRLSGTWICTYPEMPDVRERLTFLQDGVQVAGSLVPIAGPDVGKKYSIEGTLKDRLLVGSYDQTTGPARDRGAFLLQLDNPGTMFVGKFIFTHDRGDILCRECHANAENGIPQSPPGPHS
jgi:hypothetical protein